MYNGVSTLAPSFLIGSYSFLQVARTAVKAWMISKIEHGSMELVALECLKNFNRLYNGSNVVSTLVLSFWMDLHHSCRYQGQLLKL